MIAPDVGGGFGPKAQLYPEEVVVAHLARVLGRPVKWVQDRGEHLAASFHARDVRMEAELAADRNGIILGVRARALCAVGAYSAFPFTSALEPQTIGAGLSGPYRVPYYDYEGVALATNAYPGGAYRGVGFPLGPLCMETLLERVARAIGEDPVQVRRRNLVTPDELPRRGPTGALYDSGDYPALLDMALNLGGYEALRRRQQDSASDRHRLGLGIACFTEFSATNGELVRRRGLTHVPGFDSALVRVTADGAVEACLSTPSQGQSQPTTFARVLADALGVEPESVRIVLGDTELTPYGSGTFVSRSLVSGGGALRLAARELRERMCELAALLWQVDGADVAFAEGAVSHRHDAAKRLTLAEMGAIVHSASHEVPAGWDARLEAQASYDPPSMPVSAASHLAVVAVDTQTGAVDIKRYLVAEDCGPMVDQDVVEGQIRGAVAQGIGSALHEEVHYDAAGQLLTGTLQDYLVPSIFDVPAHRDRAHVYPLAVHRGWLQGDGRRRHNRRARGHRQCGERCAWGVSGQGALAAHTGAGARVGECPRGVPLARASRAAGVKPAPFHYVAPRELDEVLALLAESGDDAKILAGGPDSRADAEPPRAGTVRAHRRERSPGARAPRRHPRHDPRRPHEAKRAGG